MTSAVPDRQAEVERIQRREAWRRRLPLLPALLFAIVVTQVPFAVSFYYSLTEWELLTGTGREFIGFGNYTDLIGDRFFREVIWTSILMTVLAVVLSLLLGLGLAVLLDRKFPGQGIARTLLITPFLIMPVVAGNIWKTQMLNATFGVINNVLEAVGIGSIEFVSRFPLLSVVAVLVWQWSPFMMLIMLAGLQGQDASVLEAARVDGASTQSIFFQITLPQLRPYMELCVLLGSIYLVQTFDQIVVLTGGAVGSKNVPFFVYDEFRLNPSYGELSAYSIVVVIASIIIATFGLRVLSNLLEGETPA